MKGYTNEQWEQAEKSVKDRAAKYAYQTTNHIDNSAVQKTTFRLLMEGMTLGARMMQEELEKFNQ